VRHWAATGEITGVPEGVDLGGMGLGGVADGVAGAAGALAQGVSSAVKGVGSAVAGVGSAIAGGASSAISSIGSLFGKSRTDGLREAGDPAAIQGQLGTGQPLEGGTRARMERAFRADFTRVQLHTDATAAGLSGSLNARAFTVGEHVAFAPGEYQPGSLIGDALIAHELAHVMQQGDGKPEARAKREAEVDALEEAADQSAVSTVLTLWGNARNGASELAGRTMRAMHTGLQLQRCKSSMAKFDHAGSPRCCTNFGDNWSAQARTPAIPDRRNRSSQRRA
jgi:hypothetical protein